MLATGLLPVKRNVHGRTASARRRDRSRGATPLEDTLPHTPAVPPPRGTWVRVPLTGDFTHGAPLVRGVVEKVSLPAEFLDAGDELYRVVQRGIYELQIQVDDVLVIAPRPDGNATTGELVLCESEGHAFIARWWGKHGRRAVFYDDPTDMLIEQPDLRVLGNLTLICRLSSTVRGFWNG